MKHQWLWAFLFIGFIAFSRLPSQSVAASDTPTSELTLTISGTHNNLPDTNVDPDNGISGPVITYPVNKTENDRIPGFGSSGSYLMWLGVLVIGVNGGIVLGRRLRTWEVAAYA